MPEQRICQYEPCSQIFTPSPRNSNRQIFCSPLCCSKAWKQANKEGLSQYFREYRKNHIDEFKEYDKAYRRSNREKHNANNRAYYQRNSEKVRSRTNAYKVEHQEERLAKEKAERAEKRLTTIICQNPDCGIIFPNTSTTSIPKYCSRDCCNRAWRSANKERLAQNAKVYHEAHKEELCSYHAAYGAAYYATNIEETRARHRAYAATHREESNRANAARHAAKREEINAQHRVYYEANKEQISAKIKAYRKSHPEIGQAASSRRRARLAAAPVNDLTPSQWEAIKQHYNHRCVYCPDNCWRCQRKQHKLTIDHIVPISKGGSHTVSNIAPACSTCNKKKNAGPPPRPVQPLLFTVPIIKRPGV